MFVPPDADMKDARLFFGLPDSDALDLILKCRKGARTIPVTFNLADEAVRQVRIASAGAQTTIRVKPHLNEMDGGYSLTGQIPSASPALAGLLRSGLLTTWYGEQKTDWTGTTPGEKRALANFATACGIRL
jgi:hypothetical protein